MKYERLNYQIGFGFLSKPIHEQINDQLDLGLTAEDLEEDQSLSNQVNELMIKRILTDSETSKARKRLVKKIGKTVTAVLESRIK